MSKIVYDMNFHDVLKELFSIGGWFQGNAFQDGVFIKLDTFRNIHVYEFSEDKFGEQDCEMLIINDGIYNQHYRRVSTQPDIMRR